MNPPTVNNPLSNRPQPSVGNGVEHLLSNTSVPLDAATVAFTPTLTSVEAGPKLVAAERSVGTERDFSQTPGLRQFGDYELLREIARGGMGVVYQARHRKLHRVVAIKMILAGELASPEDVLRFCAEAEAAANLDHPGIVPVYEVGECDGQHFFAMGFVDGTSLAAELAAGPMDPTEAAEQIEKIAEAVHYAHEHGIIHRDLKPANVLLDQQNVPRITDFGLAKQLASESHLTTSGQILGTPSYMPPEQAAGAIQSIGPRSDVYSIGAILYAQLTGRPPFSAANALDTLLQVLDREPIPPKTLNPKIPIELDTICLKCLQKEPARRYGSARELADDVARFLRGEPILARPSSALDRARKWARRRPALAALWGLVIFLALSGIGGISWKWWRAEVSASTSRKLAQIAQDERDAAQLARDESKRELRRSLLAQSRAGRFGGQSGRRFDGLQAVARGVEIEVGDDLREEAIACLSLADVRIERSIRLANPSPPGVAATFDARLERYALYNAQGTITLHDSQTDQQLAKLPGPGIPISWLLRFSPDGKYLAAKHEGPGQTLFQVWNLTTRATVYKTTDAIPIAAVDYHPTAAQLALVDASGKLRLIDLGSGNEFQSWQINNQPYTISFHPEGELLAISNHTQRDVVLFDLLEGKPVGQLPHATGVRGISWGPGGKLLATASGTRIYVWDVARRRAVATMDGHGNTATHVIFNRRGTMLASSGWDGVTRFWDPRLGTQLLSLPGESIQFSHFSPDDSRLGYKTSEREIGIWQIAPGNELRTLGVAASQSPHLLTARFSHDDRLLATCSSDGLRLWDLNEYQEVFFAPLANLHTAEFTPADQGLLLADLRGLSLWPLERREESRATRLFLRATPPTVAMPADCICAQSRDGKIVALGMAHQVDIYHVESADKFMKLFSGPHANVAQVSVSPDGQWVATGTWKGTGVKVWNVRSKTMERELPIQGNATVGFSPDGKLLGTSSGQDYRLWAVPTWSLRSEFTREHGGDVPGTICFAPDSSQWAVVGGRTSGLRILSVSDNRVLAALDTGVQLPLCYSHDGTRLAVRGDKGRVHIYNLSLLDERLTQLKVPSGLLSARPTTGAIETALNDAGAARPIVVEPASPSKP